MKKTERNIKSSYKLYCEENENPVDERTYIRLCNEYNKFLVKHVTDGFEITLPERMGTLSIIGTKQVIKFYENGSPNLAIDWPATWQLRKSSAKAKEERKTVYHTNDHTDGVRYKYLWSKKRVLVTNKNFYSLRMTRANKRTVSRLVKKEGKEYFIKNK